MVECYVEPLKPMLVIHAPWNDGSLVFNMFMEIYQNFVASIVIIQGTFSPQLILKQVSSGAFLGLYFLLRKMATITEVLEFMKTLIQSIVDDTFQISKGSLSEIQTCLQYAQEQIEFLQLESQLQQKELQQWSHHFEPVFVQKIETDSHKRQDNNVIVHLDLVPNKAARLHVDAEVQLAPPKPIIRPWEDLVHNKKRTGLGYDKDLSFHIPNYSKPIQFQSARFLQGGGLRMTTNTGMLSAVPGTLPILE